MKSMLHIIMISGLLATLAVPCYLVFRGWSIKKGILLTWGLYIGYAIFASQILFELVLRFKPELIDIMPEGNLIVLAMCFGWFYGIIISLLGVLIRKLFDRFIKKTI